MRFTAVTSLLFTLLYLTIHGETLHFPPGVAQCTGGAADDDHFHPRSITCSKVNTTWKCVSTRFHDAFFRIHHVRVKCLEQCTLQYKLDFTPLAVFAIGFMATVLAGLFLGVAMYLAVLKLAERYDCQGEREPCSSMRRPGYGSFGGKLYCLGHVGGSFNSLLEFDVEEGRVQEEEREQGKEDEKMHVAEWVEREIYLG